MRLAGLIDALIASGGTLDQMRAIVAAAESADDARRAAKRAGAAERQRRSRMSRVTECDGCDDPSPKEAPPDPLRNNPYLEKQTNTSPAAGSRIRPDWQPDPAGVAFATEQGLAPIALTAEVDAFRDHWLRLGEPQADWSATWRGWIRNGLTRRKPAKTGAPEACAAPARLADGPKVNTPSGPRSVAFLIEQHRLGKWSRVYGPPIGERGCAVEVL